MGYFNTISREAFCFLAKIQNPKLNEEEIEKLVSEKLQIIVSFQTFNYISLNEILSAQRNTEAVSASQKEQDLLYAIKYYSTPYCLSTCGLEVSHVVNENGHFYVVLLAG